MSYNKRRGLGFRSPRKEDIEGPEWTGNSGVDDVSLVAIVVEI